MVPEGARGVTLLQMERRADYGIQSGAAATAGKDWNAGERQVVFSPSPAPAPPFPQ